ncbi:hypothetical protein [Campylobacter sp. US33a]|uniref:hypothetical protein n=1 Tax=Campylobacter sp. US33a TaxID=2498120 RepID=UPI001067BDE6|nr:hypothetical protein [Campylobacter sp. US33a]TEY03976.1 hypothetical protein ELQ16_01700 [Campylobacter sp. US33a]
MKQELLDFLERLTDVDKNFIYKDFNQYCLSDDILNIIDILKTRNIEKMLILWDKILSSGCVQLQHPLNNNITTRAVFNLTLGSVNTIFMIDSENKHPWIFTQATDFMNHIIVDDVIFTVRGNWPVVNLFRWKQVSYESLKYSEEKKIGLTMSMELPQHFVFHIGQFFYLMDQNNIIKNTQINPEKCFFLFQKYVKNTLNLDKNNVYLYPMGISNYATREFEKAVYREAMETIEIEEEKNQFDLIIWMGFSSGNYRKWIEMEKGIVNFILELNKYFKNIKLYYNGLTDFDSILNIAHQNYGSNYDRNNDIFKRIYLEISKVGANCTCVSLDNMDYRHKIAICETVDICISESNTTALVPFSFCNKIGVNLIPPQNPLSRKVGTIVTNDDKYILASSDNKNYHVSWQYLFNLSAELLEKLKAIKMHRLDVPSITLLKCQYELEQKLGIKLPIESVALYNELEKQINTLALHNNTSLNQALESVNTNNTLNSTLQHSLQSKDQIIQNLEDKIKDIEFKLHFKTAKARIQNHLAYKLGSALIENSKSMFGYIRMPFVLSYIRDKHKLQQKKYKENIKKHPELTLPPLEDYLDYEEALKEKECFTYKLGLALMKADREWYKGGYIRFYFESRRMKKEFLKRKEV